MMCQPYEKYVMNRTGFGVVNFNTQASKRASDFPVETRLAASPTDHGIWGAARRRRGKPPSLQVAGSGGQSDFHKGVSGRKSIRFYPRHFPNLFRQVVQFSLCL